MVWGHGLIGTVELGRIPSLTCGAVARRAPAPTRRKRVFKKALFLFGGAGLLLGTLGTCHTLLQHVNEVIQLWGALDQLGFV